jgi:hypothetical protein
MMSDHAKLQVANIRGRFSIADFSGFTTKLEGLKSATNIGHL